MPTTRIYPISDNTDGDWTNQAANNTNLYTSIDEVVLNEADWIANKVKSSVSTVLFNWTNFSGGSGTISKIKIYTQASGNVDFTFQFAVPDADHLSAAINYTGSSSLFSLEYPTNPHTGVAWTWADAFTSGIRNTGNDANTYPHYWLYADIYWEAAGGNTSNFFQLF